MKDINPWLVACGIMMNIVSTVSDLMQGFKIRYMILDFPQVHVCEPSDWNCSGLLISPSVFWLFYKAFGDLGSPHSEYPAPNTLIYSNMSIVVVEGFGSFLTLCSIFFAGAIVVKDTIAKKWAKYIPLLSRPILCH